MEVQPEGSADTYDFDAPSHVVDFRSLQEDDDADQWFDTSNNQQLVTPRADRTAALGDCEQSPVQQGDKNEEAAAEKNAPSNIVLSWGNGKQPAAPRPKAQPRRVSKRPVPEVKAATPPEKKQRMSERPAPETRATTLAVRKQRRIIVTPKRTWHQMRSSQTLNRAVRKSQRLTPKPAPKKTQPSEAPVTSTNQLKSTEQQELQRIEALQREVAQQRRRNEASYKAALAGSQPPKKQVLSTTVPKEFNFLSDARVKGSTSAADTTYAVCDFTAQLRKHPSSPLKAAPKGTTVPKPFNLSVGVKRKHSDSAAAYMPMAQQIEQYQKRTPTRYHLRSRQSQEKGPSPMKTTRPKVTNPMTPQLMTRQRNRPALVKSSAELEAEELEKIQQVKFKALKLNRKILEAAMVPKKPTVKEATQPEGFHLEIDKRLHERQMTKKTEEEEAFTFHSRPLPTRILEEVVGVPQKQVQAPTVPESPAFALKHRVRVEPKVEEVKPAPIKAAPVPHFIPFQPKLPAKTAVELCPFSFEERERERKAMKDRRMEELKKEEVPEFKAKPLPDFSEVSLPEKKPVHLTRPEPFRLQIDERGAQKNQRWERMLKEEQKQQAEAVNFKARPNTVTHKEPFVVKKENRSILASEGFQLTTERRAKERQEYEREKSEREALRALQEQQMLQEQEEQQREEMARLRKDLVHKAQPVRHYRPVEVKKSEMPLTLPQSPNFSDRFRM
ncbi:targeting protein for Xklp2 isoform X2 [Engraulis encrasicolus]|uniref:targeting protein for Xklp2 isoform X2 n=1 Tax=Engraulis encrasicolus TaxID=184585 RepID=UPI002FD0ADA0